jgi:hypothetical protein
MSSAFCEARAARTRSATHRFPDSGPNALDAHCADIVEYLDSGKIGARSVAGERILLSRPGPDLDYWDGED